MKLYFESCKKLVEAIESYLRSLDEFLKYDLQDNYDKDMTSGYIPKLQRVAREIGGDLDDLVFFPAGNNKNYHDSLNKNVAFCRELGDEFFLYRLTRKNIFFAYDLYNHAYIFKNIEDAKVLFRKL